MQLLWVPSLYKPKGPRAESFSQEVASWITDTHLLDGVNFLVAWKQVSVFRQDKFDPETLFEL